MTAANPTAMVEVRSGHGRAADAPAVDIAGVRWPAYKVHAVIAALVVALIALTITGSAAAVAWASGLALIAVWWAERAWYALHPRP